MDDIGMNPGYRNGVHDLGTCDICGERGIAFYLERCECGRNVCPSCRVKDGVSIACLVCDGYYDEVGVA